MQKLRTRVVSDESLESSPGLKPSSILAIYLTSTETGPATFSLVRCVMEYRVSSQLFYDGQRSQVTNNCVCLRVPGDGDVGVRNMYSHGRPVMGRDSILVRFKWRAANVPSARSSAPGDSQRSRKRELRRRLLGSGGSWFGFRAPAAVEASVAFRAVFNSLLKNFCHSGRRPVYLRWRPGRACFRA